jgi:hypothetical protein
MFFGIVILLAISKADIIYNVQYERIYDTGIVFLRKSIVSFIILAFFSSGCDSSKRRHARDYIGWNEEIKIVMQSGKRRLTV